MSDTKALYDVVADALAGQGREAQDALEALEALMGRLDMVEGQLESLLRTSANTTSIASAENAKRAQRAEADNAALLKALHSAYRPHAGECIRWSGATGQQVRPCPCGLDALLDAEHPGAALLEEVEGLRKQVASLKESVELLRADRAAARDAALEDAAKASDAEAKGWNDAYVKRRGEGYDVADRLSAMEAVATDVSRAIRALKKTGQGE